MNRSVTGSPTFGGTRPGLLNMSKEMTLREPLGAAKAGDTISLALRPEAGSIAPDAKGDTALSGEVVSTNFLGSVIRTRMKVGGSVISFDMFNNPGLVPPKVGEPVTLRFTAGDLLVIRD